MIVAGKIRKHILCYPLVLLAGFLIKISLKSAWRRTRESIKPLVLKHDSRSGKNFEDTFDPFASFAEGNIDEPERKRRGIVH